MRILNNGSPRVEPWAGLNVTQYGLLKENPTFSPKNKKIINRTVIAQSGSPSS